MAHIKRENWGTRIGFILATIGSAVGLGNIWRFPYLTYSNGGGAFLIPYFIALFTAGIPIIILEIAIGQRYKTTPPDAFHKMSKKASWIGWLQVFVAFVITTYYAVIVAWAINYMLFSIDLKWGGDTKTFFYDSFLNAGTGPTACGSFVSKITITTTIIWIFLWLTTCLGIKKGIESVAKIFMPLLFIGVLVLLFKVVMLDGSNYGLEWLFKPDFSRMTSFKTWAAAYGQVFFTLSIGVGVMISYASYLPDKSDISNNATMTAFINCGFSILSAIVVFSVLGYASKSSGIPMEEIAGDGIGLAFITIPMAVNLMPASTIVGLLFFLALSVAGFTSVLSIVEVNTSTIIDKFNIKRKTASAIFCTIGVLLSSLFTLRSGVFTLDIVDHYINNFGIVLAGVFEVIFVAWFFGLSSFKEHINRVSEFKIGKSWTFCLKFLFPIFLIYTATGNLVDAFVNPYADYPTVALVCYGWLIIIIIIFMSFFMHYTSRYKENKEEKLNINIILKK